MRKYLKIGAVLMGLFALVEFAVFAPWPTEEQAHGDNGIYVEPMGVIDRLRTTIAMPVMYILSGTLDEAPQETHHWNYHSLTLEEQRSLDLERCVSYTGDPAAGPKWRWGLPAFHIALVPGWGWRSYVVARPVEYTPVWYAIAAWEGGALVSRIPLSDAVRFLRGPGPGHICGVAADGHQIPLMRAGEGKVGEGGPFKKVPLR